MCTELPSFSEQLETLLAPYRADCRVVVNGSLASGAFRLSYPAFLIETYHYVRHGIALMRCARARLDAGHKTLASYLDEHIAEEDGHEAWALNDLRRLGHETSGIEASLPLAETIELIGAQQYVIDHIHPAGLFGYMHIMESTPPTTAFIVYLKQSLGIDAGALSFLEIHAASDTTHRLEICKLLDSEFKRPREREAAIVSATSGLSNLTRMFRRLFSGRFLDHLPLPSSAPNWDARRLGSIEPTCGAVSGHDVEDRGPYGSTPAN